MYAVTGEKLASRNGNDYNGMFSFDHLDYVNIWSSCSHPYPGA